jgi:uncharacterized membrane protein YkvA (DUF1232 family)
VQQLGISAQPKQLEEPKKLSGWSSRSETNTERLQRELIVVWLVLRRPGTPWYSRMIAGCVVAYVVSPVQLIPSFIPVVGLMDDVAVIATGLWLIRMLTPENVLQEARTRAETAMNRGENIRPAAVRATTVLVAGIWLALTVCLFFVLWKR